MIELEKSLKKAAVYLSNRGYCPDFVVITDDGTSEMRVVLPTIEYLGDPETGLLYLAYCIEEIETKVYTTLHQSFRIEYQQSRLFQRLFVVTDPAKLSTTLFTHYACSILYRASQRAEHIILNKFIPECR